MMNLPIDVIPNSRPQKFRWRQVIDTPIGKKVIDHEGEVIPSVETALMDLIGITKQLELENARLKEQVKTNISTKAPPDLSKKNK